MKPIVPRVAVIQDISCVGRCSLTVVIPILSVMGIQVCPLPTAILSAHLGGFGKPVFCDFTEYMTGFFQHWQQANIDFDCIYSGFLASAQQMDVVEAFIQEFSRNRPLILVDPVMGDGGKLYATYTRDMQERMQRLVSQADIITPNYTEACFLLGEPYQAGLCDPQLIEEWLVRLSALGPGRVIITGVLYSTDQLLTIGYDREQTCFYRFLNKLIPAKYPGTGDVFASVLAGSLLQGDPLPVAMEKAAGFVAAAIKVTLAAGTPPREGVLLEKILMCLGRENGSV
jgi:pyridoxine kinase